MPSRKLRLPLFALATAVVFLTVPVLSQAGELGRFSGAQPVDQSTPSAFLSTVWSLFQSLWAEEGGSLDPDGLRSTSTPEGPSIDPDGRLVHGDNGGSLDPDG